MFSIFKKKTVFLKHYRRIAEAISRGETLTPSGSKYSNTSARNWESGIRRFEAYEKEHGTIYLEDINRAWAEQFQIFLMKKGYCKNTIHVTLARLKAVLRRLYDEGISKYNGHGIRNSAELVTTVYSTIEDLKAMLDCDFSDTPGYARVRDVYVLHCFIGLRFGDLQTLLKDPKTYLRDIGGKKFFEIKTSKTGETVVIPIGRTAKEILDRYGWHFGDLFSYQYYNLAIKDVALQAGIDTDIIFTRTEGGERIDTKRMKCNLMSSHTARRTFATNAFLAGMPEKSIMSITGHKSDTSFKRYLRCSPLEAAISIANHAFFDIELSPTQLLTSPHESSVLHLPESN